MRAKRSWERVRSPHARFLEGLQAAVAQHPSVVGATNRLQPPARPTPLTVVGSADDNVIALPTDRSGRRRPRPSGRSGRGGTPAA